MRSRNGELSQASVSHRMEWTLRAHVMPRLGGEPVQALERRHVLRLVDEMAAEKSAEAARKALHALSVVRCLAVRDG